jgi:GT2 family glycosyltransferase
VTVTALLVSHDGARWLPSVLAGLEEQTRAPDRVVCVDTGSADTGPAMLAARFGADALVRLSADTGFPEAVSRGLESAPPRHDGTQEWVWLLHDDSRPAPDALERLLSAVQDRPSVAIAGPKLREWPSLRRLLEVGVTISGTGRRETGLERGEYDQGQHDHVRETLAVSSAGMLVRRDLLEQLGGFDPCLPLFGNDLDLGWRAARAGHRTIVVPDAVVFHAEAAHRGVRTTPLTRRRHRRERSAALYTLLANCATSVLPLVAVRLVLGGLLRALGLLLVRAPGEALDEMAALLVTFLRPHRLVAARRQRSRTATVPASAVRHLLPPPWLPYRHGVDLVADLAGAVKQQVSETGGRPGARAGAVDTGPVPAEAQSLPEDTGLLARLLTSRDAVALAGLVALALVAGRGLLGAGVLSGGALLPAPESAWEWFRLHAGAGSAAAYGSAEPAPPYVLPLALLGTLLLGSASAAVDLLLVLGVPVGAWGAHRLLRRLVVLSGLVRPGAAPPWTVPVGALGYALLPVLSGAVGQGRLGTVAVMVLLPWVAHAALGLRAGEPGDRRRRAGWRTGLGLAAAAAFAPVTWVVAVLAALALGMLGLVTRRGPHAGHATAFALALAVPPALLVPWIVPHLGDPGALLAEPGLVASSLVGDLGAVGMFHGRGSEVGSAPAWLSSGLLVAAAGSLARRSTRRQVAGCWIVLVAALTSVLLLDRQGSWAGTALLCAHAAAVTAVVLGGTGLADLLTGRSFGWRQPVALLLAGGSLLLPVGGAVWWAVAGTPPPVDRGPAHRLPTYMVDAVERNPAAGVLVVTALSSSSTRQGPAPLGVTLVRGPGLRLGEEHIAASAMGPGLTHVVAAMATASGSGPADSLSGLGVEFVYLPRPADAALAGSLDAASGLSAASAVRPGSRAWQVDPGARPPAATPRPWWLHVLLLLQAVLLVTVVVLAAPSRRRLR